MPTRLRRQDRQTFGCGRLSGLLAGLLVLASCGLPEGPNWPPLSDAAAVAAATADWRALHDDKAPDRPSLATLVAGDPGPPRLGAAELVGRERPLAVLQPGIVPPDLEVVLYGTLRRALELRPTSSFALVGVTPGAGSSDAAPIAAGLWQVYQALLALGLPADRVSLSTIALEGVATNEIHLYIL